MRLLFDSAQSRCASALEPIMVSTFIRFSAYVDTLTFRNATKAFSRVIVGGACQRVFFGRYYRTELTSQVFRYYFLNLDFIAGYSQWDN